MSNNFVPNSQTEAMDMGSTGENEADPNGPSPLVVSITGTEEIKIYQTINDYYGFKYIQEAQNTIDSLADVKHTEDFFTRQNEDVPVVISRLK